MNIYDFKVKTIEGKDITLSDYHGKVILIVNVASKCGFTPQYEGLEKIYQDFKDKGFVILGFPANNFLWQEPSTNSEIQQFCTLNYNVTFPMFSKISVKGKDIDPLYKFLTDKKTDPKYSGDIKWNFNKFLIDKEGNITARYDSQVKPEDNEITGKIKELLDK